MKHYLTVTLLTLTMASGLAVAADPPAQSTSATPTSPLDQLGLGTNGKPQSTRSTVNLSGPYPIIVEGAIKPIQAVGAKTPKYDDLGYTQVGGVIKVKLDRPKTQLSLYENSTYTIILERDDVGIVGAPNPLQIHIEDVENNYTSIRTIEPGITTLTYSEDTEKQYLVEITILGDTRQLQSQLDKLYPRASIEAIKVGESVLLRGTASKQEHIAEIIEIAEQFYPKVLNQMKVAGVPVGQALPVRPQMMHGNKPTAWSSSFISPLNRLKRAEAELKRAEVGVGQPLFVQPQSLRGDQAKAWSRMNKRLPASVAITTSKPQITVQATVLEIDWKKLKETKIDFRRTIRAFATDPRQRDLSSQATKKSSFIPVVVPGHTTDSILHLLTATKAVKVVSRPVIRTQAGRSADVFIGEKIPIVEKKEIQNGKQVLETVYRNIGTILKLTPELASHGGTKLSVVVEHQQRVDGSFKIPGKSEGPNIQTRKFALDVGLKVGQSVILTETSPLSNKQKKQSVSKGLMVVLSPPVIGMTSKNLEYIPVTSLQWIPEQSRFADMIRMVPKIIPTKTVPENGVYSDRDNSHTPGVPQPIRPPASAAPQPEPQDLRQSVRELRSDVRALRQDVGRLLKILEKKETSWNELRRSDMTPTQPTQGAIHRRIKESKTDLLVFHASWSGPCQKMASLLDEQADRGYSIRRLDLDKNRELAKELGVTSVPAIVAFANGKEDERWVGILGKDALTRIVDKYALRRTANLKGIWQSSTRTPEHRLHQVLTKEVSLKSEKIPLVDVMRALNQSEGINIHIDSRGLEEEGVELKAPVTIDVKEITVKSALNLILEPLNLAYQFRDEVLVITSHTRAQGKKVVVTYPVADLVIPIPTAGPVPGDKKAPSASLTVSDFDSLTGLIQSSVDPRSWEVVGGSGSIRPHESTLSLVIRQSSQAHQEIENLLAQLRRLQDLQVTLESRFLDKLPEGVWKKLGIDFDSKKKTNGPLGGIILTDEQAELLQQAAQNDGRANLMQGPKVTLFNGQTGAVRDTVKASGKRQPLKHLLHMQPVVSPDRRNVRLNLQVSDLKSPGAETRAYINTVPDGKAMLIEIVQPDANKVGVPISEKSQRFKNISVGRRFLLIRPRIMVQEEEAILLPDSKLRSMLMLTPRGVIAEEEEELLGIEKPE